MGKTKMRRRDPVGVSATLAVGKQAGRPAMDLYDRAVANGHYMLDSGGLMGKHDNVRRYWEDALTREFLRPVLHEIVDRCYHGNCRRVRIFDLGCGSGQGYELITTVKAKDASIYEHEVELLPPYMIGRYVGCDLSEAMVSQARATYGDNGKFEFRQADFGQGLPVEPHELPFHFYFSSYGSLSHICSDSLTALLAEIGQHAADGSFIILDLLGRYSYEWPCYWQRPASHEDDMWDYRMSYLPGEEPERSESWPMRYWSVEEVLAAVAEAAELSGAELQVVRSFDRSIFVGRHMDTRQYNPYAPPLRSLVNQLHEGDVRTDLTGLLIDFVPHGEDDKINSTLEHLSAAWNGLVRFCLDKLSAPENGGRHLRSLELLPRPLQQGIRTMDKVIENVGWMQMGDARSNIIEPQLGYALRGLEAAMQPGAGFGHGLLVAIRVGKKPRAGSSE